MIKNSIIRFLKFLKIYKLCKNIKKTICKPLYFIKEFHHKSKMLRFYSEFINEGDLCFDIGANIGNRTEIFIKLGARVIAIEPQDICVSVLKKRFRKNERVIILQNACGENQGYEQMMISNANTISSMSNEWIKSVKDSGRFSDCKWEKNVVVSVTTLDKLIQKYGEPNFIKIDVEGYEYQLIKGCSLPVKAKISFEFTPEFIESAINCINHISKIGNFQFNYSIGESMHLALLDWITDREICDILTSLSDKSIFGDVYARPIY